MHEECQYLDLLRKILEEGNDKGDRTGVGTYSIFGHQMRFDLRNNFPILTTKKVYWKGVVEELLWFLRGETDSKILEDKNVNIWKANTTREFLDKRGLDYPEGEIGSGYGKQFRRWETPGLKRLILVKKRTAKNGAKYTPSLEEKQIVSEYKASKYDGLTVTKKETGETYKIIGRDKKSDKYVIEFEDGVQCLSLNIGNIKNGQIKNPFYNSIYGVACRGRQDKKLFNRSWYNSAYNMWRSMIVRCYNVKHPSYKNYGEIGVGVDERWLCFANFVKDIVGLPYFQYWHKNPSEYYLDKDYFASKVYSRKTCIFLHKYENLLYSNYRPVVIRHENVDYKFLTITEAAKEFNLDCRRVHDQGSGKHITYKDLKINFLEEPNGFVYRYEKIIDQLSNIINLIKNEPNSRRIVMTLWNPADLKYSCLPPCHGQVIQFYVNGGKLSCLFHMRSIDSFLGLPFNLSSYALLTCLLAKIVGLEPGELVWSGGDVHIYKNHIEQVKEQLTRTPYQFPVLNIKKELNSIEDIEKLKYEDIELIGYKSHPTIKAEMAV
ncbi:MAG: thymidylate synthase [Elusimicrobiota bacterium]